MSFEEKNAWSLGVITVIGYAVYLAVVLPQLGRPVDEIGYQIPLLAVIGGGIVSGMVVALVLGLGRRGTEKDVRDREIEHFGDRIGVAFLVIGMLAALVLAMLEVHGFWIANAVFLCFILNALLSTTARLVAYRRGFQEW